MDALQVRLTPPTSALTRTGSRAARVGAFAFETWSRLTVRGATSLEDSARELSWVAENMCALHGIRPSLRGRIPREPSVLVANHITYFDPLVLASLMPLTAVAKSEVRGWPIVGELARKLGVLFVSRGDALSGARVLREAMTALSSGISVLVFPEGTTTRGASVLPFRRGIFGAARALGVPVIPVALRYHREDAAWVGSETFVAHYARSITQACTRVSVRFLPPLCGAQSAEELAESARVSIANALSATPLEHPLESHEMFRLALA